ncbi:hypothetical protein CANARDRAFT_29678 [[Candida] arabinofermentans NRRL YB-2248]|uniref:Uncharacterized protein n=1 Tax=[Candida] arabinofermentans NRRL YB-2248 TaxID=983967 RepID=A0A1E4SVZ3_9ASCO|nr:hypothetical protein CANARDRAFT_29678 [[Candida] arabinofermentans NRRL YB-2248]
MNDYSKSERRGITLSKYSQLLVAPNQSGYRKPSSNKDQHGGSRMRYNCSVHT